MIVKFSSQKMALSLDKRYEIVFLHEHPVGPKWSFGKIAKHVRCSKSTAIYWAQKYHNNKDLSTEERSGRPRITTAKQDERITEMAKKEHNITATQIQKNMEEWDLEISVETVKRRLREAGGKYTNEIPKPLLKERHRKARLEWAKKHQNFDWSRVIFTDESTFQLYTSKKKFGSSSGEEKYFVPSSIHRKSMFGGVFLLGGLVSWYASNGILTRILCVGSMSGVFWLLPPNILARVA